MNYDPHTGLPISVRIRHEMRPGDIGAITQLHGLIYNAEYGWDYTFEAYVAGPLAEFARVHTERERVWIVERNDEVAGSIGIVDAHGGAAQLRWFLLDPPLRGKGLGRRLMDEAIAFAMECDYTRVFLWTVSALEAAAHVYRAAGFEVTQEHTTERWGQLVTEQRYDLRLN